MKFDCYFHIRPKLSQRDKFPEKMTDSNSPLNEQNDVVPISAA